MLEGASEDKDSTKNVSSQGKVEGDAPASVSWFDHLIDKKNISKYDQINSGFSTRLPEIVKPEDDYERDLEYNGPLRRK